jgi:hypothetical protein
MKKQTKYLQTLSICFKFAVGTLVCKMIFINKEGSILSSLSSKGMMEKLIHIDGFFKVSANI